MVLVAMGHLFGNWPDRYYIQTIWQSRTRAKCAMLTARGRGEYAQVRHSVWRRSSEQAARKRIIDDHVPHEARVCVGFVRER